MLTRYIHRSRHIRIIEAVVKIYLLKDIMKEVRQRLTLVKVYILEITLLYFKLCRFKSLILLP